MRKRFKSWVEGMGYEKGSELIGELMAVISFFILLFMLSIIGG